MSEQQRSCLGKAPRVKSKTSLGTCCPAPAARHVLPQHLLAQNVPATYPDTYSECYEDENDVAPWYVSLFKGAKKKSIVPYKGKVTAASNSIDHFGDLETLHFW